MLRRYLILIFLSILIPILTKAVCAQDVQALKNGVVRIDNSVLNAQGTGFIIHINPDQTEAFVITASHVVEGIERPDIYLPNRREPVKGRIVNREAEDQRGLALLAIGGDANLFSGLAVCEFGNSSELAGGESGQVIGFPGGTLISTVTPATIARREGRTVVFSGNINAGNSGGPLVINGKVIGVVMEVRPGFAYATPAEMTLLYIDGIAPNISSGLRTPRIKPVSDRVIVLVADFKSKDQKTDQVTQTIVTQLRNATRDYPDIEIQYLGEHISDQQGSGIAQARGTARNASIVLWGGYSTAQEEVLVDIHFEILQQPRGLDLSQVNETFRAPIAELKKNFNIQTRLSNKMAYVTLLTTGLARLESDDYDGAVGRFTSALNQPDAPDRLADRSDVFFNRAKAYQLKALFTVNNSKVRSDLFGLAINDLNKYVSLQRDDVSGYVLRATTYLLSGNRESALADVNKAIELDSKYYVAYMIRGLVYLDAEDTERSITNINKAIQLMGENVDEDSKGLLYFLRATLHMLKDDFEGAINDFTKAMATEPSSSQLRPYLFLLRGAAFGGNGDYDSAVQDFSEAIKLDSTNAIFYWARGQAYDENANDVGAIDNYTQAISLMSANGTRQVTFGIKSIDLVDIYESRAKTYERAEKNDRAISDLEQVERLTSDVGKRQEANKKIQELRTKKVIP